MPLRASMRTGPQYFYPVGADLVSARGECLRICPKFRQIMGKNRADTRSAPTSNTGRIYGRNFKVINLKENL